MNLNIQESLSIFKDSRFTYAVELFNSGDWYPAHDLFEELWHESVVTERTLLQGLLQIAVAQVHLNNGNINGATILYGEGLGRLKNNNIPDVISDFDNLIQCLEKRLKLLQQNKDPDIYILPTLEIIYLK
tara:strand:- start:928 stop:1317 length:390 start_codon:yes stop_codon:yes gene_type:complete